MLSLLLNIVFNVHKRAYTVNLNLAYTINRRKMTNAIKSLYVCIPGCYGNQ